jgi:hypothetical protein
MRVLCSAVLFGAACAMTGCTDAQLGNGPGNDAGSTSGSTTGSSTGATGSSTTPDAATSGSSTGATGSSTTPDAATSGSSTGATGSSTTPDAATSGSSTGATGSLTAADAASDAPTNVVSTCNPGPASSPESSASSSNVVGNQGATIQVQDGYATLYTTSTQGTLYTSYGAQLSFVFSDFVDTLGYLTNDQVPAAGRVLFATGAVTLNSTTAPVTFAPGEYTSNSPAWTLAAYPPNCGPLVGQSEDVAFGEEMTTVTITSISDMRIAGSIDAPGADGGDMSVVFDIPLVNLNEVPDGSIFDDGPTPGPRTVGNCCLP